MSHILDTIRLAQEMQRIHKQALDPTLTVQADILKQLSSHQDAFRHVREQIAMQEAMVREFKSNYLALVNPATEAVRSIATMLDATRIESSIALLKSQAIEAAKSRFSVLDTIKANTAADWLAKFDSTKTIRDAVAFPLQTHLAVLYERSALAELTLARVKADSLGVKLGLAPADRAELAAEQEAFGTEYRSYYDDVSGSKLGVLEVPAPLTELPAGEFINQAALVVSTSEAEVDEEAAEAEREVTTELAVETADHLTSLIADLNPDLPHLLKGAREAYASRHTDYVRHFVTSYRELFTHVLHALAPDDELRKWSTDPNHFDKNRPTRRARLLYITRDLTPSFGGFMNADVEAVVKFIEAFQKGTHGIKPSFTEEQLKDLKNRTEGLLRFMLIAYRVTTFGRP